MRTFVPLLILALMVLTAGAETNCVQKACASRARVLPASTNTSSASKITWQLEDPIEARMLYRLNAITGNKKPNPFWDGFRLRRLDEYADASVSTLVDCTLIEMCGGTISFGPALEMTFPKRNQMTRESVWMGFTINFKKKPKVY